MSKEVLLSKSVDPINTKTNNELNNGEKPAERPDNPKLGIAYFCLAGAIFCFNFMFGKVLYEHHPSLGAT